MRILAEKIAAFEGPVAEYLKDLSPEIYLVVRIYFHLIENTKGETHFAFLATYSTRLDEEGESRHLPPLKFALEEYQGARKKLLALFVPIYEATAQSEMVAELLACTFSKTLVKIFFSE